MKVQGWLAGAAVALGVMGCQGSTALPNVDPVLPEVTTPTDESVVVLGRIHGLVDAEGHHMWFEPAAGSPTTADPELGVSIEALTPMTAMGGMGRGANAADSLELITCQATTSPTCDTPYGAGSWIAPGTSTDPAVCGTMPAGRTTCYRADIEARPFYGREVSNLYVRFVSFSNAAGTAPYDIVAYGGAAPTLGLVSLGTVVRYGTTEVPPSSINLTSPPHQASLRSWLWAFPPGATDLTFRYVAEVLGSVASAATPAPYQPSVTAAGDATAAPVTQGCTTMNGHYTVVASEAALLPGHPAGTRQIYRVRRLTGAVELVSVAAAGGFSNGHASSPCITPDGASVVFESDATDLVATADTNATTDVFVRSLATGTNTLVSKNAAGAGTRCGRGGGSIHGSISNDGRYVAFSSTCASLCGGDSQTTGCYTGRSQVYRYDLTTSTLTGVSVRNGSSGTIGASTLWGGAGTAFTAGTHNSQLGWMSLDGDRVVFSSTASGAGYLAPNEMDTGTRDVFVRIVGSSTTIRISDNRGGAIGARNPHISADGLWVVFETGSTTMAAGVTDTNNAADIVRCSSSGGSCAYVSLTPGGATGNRGSARPWLGGDGRLVAFESDAFDLEPTDGNFQTDIFVYDTVSHTLRMRSWNGFGALADGPASRPRFDPTATYLLYQSAANNMQNDPAGAFDSDGGAADVFMIRLP
ncbi:MAG: hypothetical protein K1X94_29980 [Sandaracinaceae bacterium]|nr:hypothetical protein [Sandaracinaceae bacterium]